MDIKTQYILQSDDISEARIEKTKSGLEERVNRLMCLQKQIYQKADKKEKEMV